MSEIVKVAYYGALYPVTVEVANAIFAKIESFEVLMHSDFFQFATVDGRQITLRVGPSIPIGFEAELDGGEADL